MDSQSSSSLKFIRLLRVVSSSQQRPNQPRPQGLLAFQYGGGRREDPGIARVASVSVWFRSKERPRNGILGFGRARNETRAIFERSLTIVPRSLLLNRTVTLATQANPGTQRKSRD